MQMPSLLKSPPHIPSISYKDKLVANQSHNYFSTQLSSINETDLIDEGDNIHLGTSFIPITSKDKKKRFINVELLLLSSKFMEEQLITNFYFVNDKKFGN